MLSHIIDTFLFRLSNKKGSLEFQPWNECWHKVCCHRRFIFTTFTKLVAYIKGTKVDDYAWSLARALCNAWEESGSDGFLQIIAGASRKSTQCHLWRLVLSLNRCGPLRFASLSPFHQSEARVLECWPLIGWRESLMRRQPLKVPGTWQCVKED